MASTSTIKGNCLGLPTFLVGMKWDKPPLVTFFMVVHSLYKIAITTWFNSKLVSFLNTNTNLVEDAKAFQCLQGE